MLQLWVLGLQVVRHRVQKFQRQGRGQKPPLLPKAINLSLQWKAKIYYYPVLAKLDH